MRLRSVTVVLYFLEPREGSDLVRMLRDTSRRLMEVLPAEDIHGGVAALEQALHIPPELLSMPGITLMIPSKGGFATVELQRTEVADHLLLELNPFPKSSAQFLKLWEPFSAVMRELVEEWIPDFALSPVNNKGVFLAETKPEVLTPWMWFPRDGHFDALLGDLDSTSVDREELAGGVLYELPFEAPDVAAVAGLRQVAKRHGFGVHLPKLT